MMRSTTFLVLLAVIQIVASCQSPPAENHLAGESSPYLLMHAHNPVDWYPWSEEALNKARKENKLLLISCGYAACHWCHVMEEGAFSDTAVARYLNQHFVAIKVDREERPDIDALYMQSCLMGNGGSCGWPLNTFALPDGRPIYSGTYYPARNFLEVLQYFYQQYTLDPAKINAYAAELERGIRSSLTLPVTDPGPISPDFQKFTANLVSRIDWTNGGFTGAPKFPMPVVLQYLLSTGHLLQDSQAIQGVLLSLDRMAEGGIYDQLEGGFARYSVDEQWRIPHFEKMLYDNALLIQLYAQGYKYNHDPNYARIIRESIDFVFAHLAGENYFYSSMDADSEGGEGTYYQWKWSELQAGLRDATVFSLATAYYGAKPTGNWELGKNILQAPRSLTDLESKFGKDSLAIITAMAEARDQLKSIRSQRPAPAIDAKAITSWNALMIIALSESAQALGNHAYRTAALATGEFIWNNLYDKHEGLHRIFIREHSQGPAHLEDYAYLIRAYISLYELSFEKIWLERAQTLTKEVLKHFGVNDSPLFYSTSDLQDQLIVRAIQWQDEIMPTPNAVMGQNLFMLGSLLDIDAYRDHSAQMANAVNPYLVKAEDPFSLASWMTLSWYQTRKTHEIAIVGDRSDQLRIAMQKEFIPMDLFMGSDQEENLALLKGKYQPDHTWIYVCEQGICKQPVQDVPAALNLLQGN
ncbi:MAG: thioredoxin domain-containing protein [Saprospiraceae bacterium]|nr:thioredoxin domain-containing protein [Saprospiraceae bacterium]MCB9318867.1 thioredoxin domain-containing protein [Lewinellaceae bacterium]